MTACTQPACTGTIIDEYCDVCGSPAGADPFVPAEAAASAAPLPSLLTAVPAPTGRPALSREESPEPKNRDPMMACTQPAVPGPC